MSDFAKLRQASRIPWATISSVPSGWEVRPCRSVVRNMESTNEGAANQHYLSLMANVGIIPYAEKGDVGNKKPEDLTKCKLVSKGDLVINSMNYAIGSYGMSGYDGVCSPVYLVLRVREESALSRFALRIFENVCFQKYVASLGNGILEYRAAIGWDDIKGINVLLPSKPVQRAILDFVDEAMGRVDRLVALRRRQMELLREQRAALIQQAVTRGLNPIVPLKNSCLPWLGQIPKHWNTISLGRLAVLLQTGPFGSQLHAEEYVEGGIPVINPSHMSEGKIQHDPKCTVESETAAPLSRHFLRKGDIVFARRGELGRCGLVRDQEVGWLCGTGSLLMRPDQRVLHPEYLVALFQLTRLKEELTLQSVGSTMDNLNTDILSRMGLPLPPLEEQQGILHFIVQQTVTFDSLHSAYERQLELLTEYRAALIHECVTGQRAVGG